MERAAAVTSMASAGHYHIRRDWAGGRRPGSTRGSRPVRADGMGTGDDGGGVRVIPEQLNRQTTYRSTDLRLPRSTGGHFIFSID